MAPIAIASHMFTISRSSHKIWSAITFAFVFNAVLLHWTSTFVGSIPWIILSLGLSIFYIPLSLVGRWGIGTYPLIFITFEEARNRFPFGGFGWARVAYSQVDSPYAEIASVGGAIALSSITVMLGAFIFYLLRKHMHILHLVPLFLIIIPQNITQTGQASALLIQGNVPELGLDFNLRAEEVFNNHVIETRKALKGSKDVDFILWPENSVDVDPFINKKVFESLESFDSPLIIGAIVEQDKQLLNTSILWQETSQEIYVKRHLTPFGEYIPLRPLAELISPLTDRVNDFSPGDQQKTFVLGEAKIAPIICYELIDDQILQEAASNSNLFVVQTNSATFGMSAESAQQLSIARVRAIENSRNILSVSTTGYSAVIDYRGKILQKTSMATAEHLYADVGLINQESLRNRMGDWASVFTLIWVFIASRERWIIRR
jgi:apolipoprotein N-acyltransferase